VPTGARLAVGVHVCLATRGIPACGLIPLQLLEKGLVGLVAVLPLRVVLGTLLVIGTIWHVDELLRNTTQ
jgi:hypothetical protein